MLIIRNEKASDLEAITEVTNAAFEDHPSNQQTEHLTIQDLRTDGALTISLLCEVEGRVVGHIAFSSVTISDGTTNWHGLGPLSVLPEYQGRRIGTSLINRGLALLESMNCEGVVLVGLPTYFTRFGFWHYPQLIHEGTPQEVFVVKPLTERLPCGTVEFHQAFKQLSAIEKDTIADVIIDYAIAGIKVNFDDPVIESLIQKEILTEMPDGKVVMRPAVLAEYDSYLAKVGQFRATEVSRVHKNPILTAIKCGN